MSWSTARGDIPLSRPLIAGILNVTPDSFSDGGAFLDPDAALAHALTLVEHGAGCLDIGAESTRPGRPHPVDADEEWRRLEPVLTRLVAAMPDHPITVDTVKSETARRAIDAGAWAINDVSGLRLDPAIAAVCAERGAGLVVMHSRGTVSTMATYDLAQYGDVGQDVLAELGQARDAALAAGVPLSGLVVDPGLGFAKTPDQTWAVFRRLADLAALGCPVMVGPSRKRFLGEVTGRDPGQRDVATAAACVAAYFLGATIFRVHAVAPVRDALAVAMAVRGA